MVSTSGKKLITKEAEEVLIKKLMPLATVITPNIPEAESLSGITINDRYDMEKAAEIIWKGSFQSDYFICKWVTKSQLPGMERSSFEAVIPIIYSAFRILFSFAVTHFQTRSRIMGSIF